MAYDAGLAERVADTLGQIGEHGVRQKNVFGGRGFLAGKSTFVIVREDGLLVKTPADEYPALLKQPGIAPFAPGALRSKAVLAVCKTYTLAEPLFADDDRGSA